jgi:hypothetical protein
VVTKWAFFGSAFVAVAMAVIAVRPVQTPGPLARDFEAYWAAGTAYNAQVDPYGRAIWDSERSIPGVDARRYELLPFVGPPHTLLAWSLAARLSYETATYVWWSVLALSLLALVAAVIRGSSTRGDLPTFIGGMLLAITFAPISSDLALGQIALIAFCGAALVVVFAPRSWPASVLAACVAFAQPNASIGLVSQLGRNRATLAIGLGALLAYLLGAIAAGWCWPFAYVIGVIEHGGAERFAAIQFDPASIAFDFGASPLKARLVEAFAASAALVAGVVLAVRVRDAFARFAVLSALSPFVVGFFHEHDFVVAFAAASWCALRTRGGIRLVALAGTLMAGFDWLGLAQRQSGIAQCALLSAGAFAAFIALGDIREIRTAIPVAIGMAILVAGTALLAMHHPVPIWPDALTAIHLPSNATIAAIWHEEQRATGLLAPVPAWGLLRVFSLLGCALLVCAIYRHSSCYRTASPHWDGNS